MSLKSQPKHPFDRQAGIADLVRRKIVAGDWIPGDRVPTRQKLTDQFKTTLVTAQKAISRLEADGFVESRGRHGTFVAAYPPHIYRFGLLLHEPVSMEPGGSRFLASLAHVAAAMANKKPRRITTYLGVAGAEGTNEEVRRLIHDATHDCLAGLIVTDRFKAASAPVSTIISETKLPAVGMFKPDPPSRVRGLALSFETLMRMAFERFKSAGRKRVALITYNWSSDGFFSMAQSICPEFGLETKYYWRVDGDVRCPQSVKPAIQMLMRLPVDDRPDAILIADDNLVPQATAALAEMGQPVLDSLTVVAQANFPLVTDCVIPAARIGFDAHDIVTRWLDFMDVLRKTPDAPEQPPILPVWDHQASGVKA